MKANECSETKSEFGDAGAAGDFVLVGIPDKCLQTVATSAA